MKWAPPRVSDISWLSGLWYLNQWHPTICRAWHE